MLPSRPVVGQFAAQRADQLGDFVALMNSVGKLLRRQRNQHAERDNSQLPRDGAPAVRRLELQ